MYVLTAASPARRFLFLAALALGLSAPLRATYTAVTLPTLNTDIRTWSGGGVYAPLFPSSSQTLGGVPFEFQASTGGMTAFSGGSVVIPVNVYGVTEVHTLINSAWGSLNSVIGSLVFTGSEDTYTVFLVEGVNVRDHFYGGFVNSTSASYVTQAVWGSAAPNNSHLDLQSFVLPAEYALQTLVSVTFNSGGGYPAGQPFLAGMTVESASIPDGGSSLLLLGAALLGLALRRRRAA